MEKIKMTWQELVNRYDDDQQSFEEYFCNQLSIPLASFDELDQKYCKKTFTIKPNADYIRWRGTVNSDFRVIVMD